MVALGMGPHWDVQSCPAGLECGVVGGSLPKSDAGEGDEGGDRVQHSGFPGEHG